MTKSEHHIFLSVFDDATSRMPCVFFRHNRDFPFPKGDFDTYPEIALVVDTIESFFKDVMLYLTLGISNGDSPALKETCEEIVIATQKSELCKEETFFYLITPIGAFDMEFFREKPDGGIVELPPVVITDEMKRGLFLAPCEVAFDDHLEILHVYDPKMPFPPLTPGNYISGSPQQKHATEYYKFKELKDQGFEEWAEENLAITHRNKRGGSGSPITLNVASFDKALSGGRYVSDWDDDSDYDDDEDDDALIYQDEVDTMYYVIRPESY